MDEDKAIPQSRESEAAVRLPRVANARRLVIFFVALVAIAGLSFVGGTLVRAPQQSALDAVDDHLEVTYVVEERVVAAGLELPGRVVSGSVQPLAVLGPGASAESGGSAPGRVVVTRRTLEGGQAVVPGTLLGEVSGRPLIAVPTDVPLYRNLTDGATGADVSALQGALSQMGLDVSVTGEVGSRTLAAVAELYARLGIEPLDTSTIIWSEFFPVTQGATVVSASPVGTVLSEETPLAAVKVSPDVVLARANVLESDQLAAGSVVQLRSASAVTESTIISVGEFSTSETDSTAGRDITVGIPADFAVTESEPVTISLTQAALPGPAVPVIALRQDSKGTYVELADGRTDSDAGDGSDSSTASREKVYVVVSAQADGWAAIEPNEELAIGSRIFVSP